MAYKIEVDEVGNYIEYLRKFKKKLESELLQFEKDLKNAHEFWDDNNYEETIKAKEIVAKEHKKLIDAIETSLKKLKQMHMEYETYLKRGKR
jgi:RNA polymerase-binding transcription factor DksA